MIAILRSLGFVIRRLTQLAAISAANLIRVGSASCATRLASTSELKVPALLKAIARENIRPSTSGKAIFIARSRDVSPWEEASQASFELLDNTTCKTTLSSSSSTVPLCLVFMEETANPVAFNTSGGEHLENSSLKVATDTGSLRLEINTGRTFIPRFSSASINASIAPRPPDCTNAR